MTYHCNYNHLNLYIQLPATKRARASLELTWTPIVNPAITEWIESTRVRMMGINLLTIGLFG